MAAIMPSPHAGFSVIEQYRNLARHVVLEEDQQTTATTCRDVVAMDQEVPQMRTLLEGGDFDYTNIKSDVSESAQPDLITFMENILDNGKLSTEPEKDVSVSASRIPTIVNMEQTEFQQMFGSRKDTQSNSQFLPMPSSFQFSTVSSTLSPSQSSLSSTSSSPMLSSTAFTPSSSSSSLSPLISSLPMTTSHTGIQRTPTSQNNVRMSSFVTELGGSGCVVMAPAESSTDLLTNEMFSIPTTTTTTSIPNFLSMPPEECVDYLDLDRQPVTLYDELKLPIESIKTEAPGPNDSTALEEAALYFRDVIHHDCDSLKVPYDPTLWSEEHVQIWVSWVCRKNNLPSVSKLALPLDGKALCSLSAEELLSHYGDAGVCINTELDIWKAANSCFPESYLPQTAMPVAQQYSSNMQYSRVNVQGATTPCVSPAPSSDSSLDSSTGLGTSSRMMDSDSDEEYSSGETMPTVRPIRVGRGHKQTIHLWEFLRELLLSKENHSDCIRWLDRKTGIFKIEDSKKVAHLWGVRKNRPAMNYDKLSRSVRQYYKKKIIKKTQTSKRLVYQFCPGYL